MTTMQVSGIEVWKGKTSSKTDDEHVRSTANNT
jgi:hypothetical protein